MNAFTRKFDRSATSAFAMGLLALGTLMSDAAEAAVLYGISLNGHNSGSPGASSLYGIDPLTGAGTQIGTDLGHAVNSIAADPTTGLLYGSTTTWSGSFNGLLQIDPLTGTATEIGAFGPGFSAILGLTFDSTGGLFGWHDPSADDPVSIDILTGQASTIGDAGLGTAGQVLAFDNADNLTLFQGSSVYDVDTSSGAANFLSSLGFNPGAGGGDFDPLTGLLWASAFNGRTLDSIIRVTDIGNNSFTDIDTDVEFLNALTFAAAPVAVPEPASAGLLGMGLAGIGLMLRRRRKPGADD